MRIYRLVGERRRLWRPPRPSRVRAHTPSSHPMATLTFRTATHMRPPFSSSLCVPHAGTTGSRTGTSSTSCRTAIFLCDRLTFLSRRCTSGRSLSLCPTRHLPQASHRTQEPSGRHGARSSTRRACRTWPRSLALSLSRARRRHHRHRRLGRDRQRAAASPVYSFVSCAAIRLIAARYARAEATMMSVDVPIPV